MLPKNQAKLPTWCEGGFLENSTLVIFLCLMCPIILQGLKNDSYRLSWDESLHNCGPQSMRNCLFSLKETFFGKLNLHIFFSLLSYIMLQSLKKSLEWIRDIKICIILGNHQAKIFHLANKRSFFGNFT